MNFMRSVEDIWEIYGCVDKHFESLPKQWTDKAHYCKLREESGRVIGRLPEPYGSWRRCCFLRVWSDSADAVSSFNGLRLTVNACTLKRGPVLISCNYDRARYHWKGRDAFHFPIIFGKKAWDCNKIICKWFSMPADFSDWASFCAWRDYGTHVISSLSVKESYVDLGNARLDTLFMKFRLASCKKTSLATNRTFRLLYRRTACRFRPFAM